MSRNRTTVATAVVVVISVSVLGAVIYFFSKKKVKRSKKSVELGKSTNNELKQIFYQCCEDAALLTNTTNGDKLVLYGLYKQCTVGDAPEEKPSILNVVSRAKHDSWSKFHGMPQHAAMLYYIEAVRDFRDGDSISSEEKEFPSTGLGLRPSQLIHDDEEETKDDASLEAKLRQAAASENLIMMKNLIEKGADFHHTDENGETALHFCADRGMLDGVVYLLELGANPNAADNDGISVLQTAVIAGHAAICKILIDEGADPDQKDVDGDSPRLCAEEENKDTIMELFSKRQKNVEGTK